MGFVADIANGMSGGLLGGIGSIAGGLLGLGGAKALGADPRNQFQAQSPDIVSQDFLSAIQRARNPNFIDYSGADQTAQRQKQLSDALMATVNGTGANPAQLQYQKNVDQNAQQAAGMIGGIRGLNPALAARLIMQNYGGANQKAAADQGITQAQQQLAAAGTLGGVLGTQRGQDISQVSQGRQLQTQYEDMLQRALANQNAQKSANSLNAQGINAGVASGNAAYGQKLQGGISDAISGGSSVPIFSNQNGDSPEALAKSALSFSVGGRVPGTSEVPGDSEENDTVPAMVSPGEIIIPKSVASKGTSKIIDFVDALKKHKGKNAKPSYGKVLKSHKMLSDRISQLEKFACGGMVYGRK